VHDAAGHVDHLARPNRVRNAVDHHRGLAAEPVDRLVESVVAVRQRLLRAGLESHRNIEIELSV
jgi:hypothetical protein